MKISLHMERWLAKGTFRIAGREFREFDSIIVVLKDEEGHIGRGEALGVSYLGETPSTMIEQLESLLRLGQLDQVKVQECLPPGGARNALDCAFWDLQSKRSGRRVWDLAGVAVQPLRTAYTISVGTEQAMGDAARRAADFGILKLKLDSDRPVEKVESVRDARVDARLVIDANQSWSQELLSEIAGPLRRLGVELIEQPLPKGNDESLVDYQSPIPLCADESFQSLADLDDVAARYQMANIKLDKAGGLTCALAMVNALRLKGLKIMVGSMAGSSLALAPAFVIAQLSDLADLDGPLLMKYDRVNGIQYSGETVHPFPAECWG